MCDTIPIKDVDIPSIGTGKDIALINAMADTIHGLRENDFITNETIFLSYGISRSELYVTPLSVRTADFFKFSDSSIQSQGGRR